MSRIFGAGSFFLPVARRVLVAFAALASVSALPCFSQQPLSAQAQHQQQLQQLIQQVNVAYAAGDADYRKGQLAEAKVEFDHAVDLMLSSSFDIKSDPALEAVFNRIVDNINGLEMDALKEGNGFAPPVEPTPADVAADVTFGTVDPNILAKAKTQLATTKSDLPMVVNEYVATFINFFANTQKGHNTLLHSFQRGGRYRNMIQRVMAEEGVPQDLIYLAVAESGFNPRAIGPKTRSLGRAGGMWQFMPVGDYGLERNTFVDERFDPEKSTRAYARYMKFLYDQLGDWYLAMAAYDWGAGNIQRAVQKTGYADFWELYKRNNLPGETRNYVPEILAAIIIANNPTQYGFDEITLDPPVLTDTVTVNYSLDLRLVSDVVNAPVDELEALNPSLLRNITPPNTSFDLHLPAGVATLFQQRIAKIPESKRTAWRYHRIAADDTLATVAHTYRISESELAEANQLREGQGLAGVEGLVVPVAPVVERTAHASLYTTRRGDTLVSIADRFSVSLDQLRRWNSIASGVSVAPGSKLHIAEPAAVSHTGKHHAGTASSATRNGNSQPAKKKQPQK
ncbi:transglycosylase SLT domain-containing protein [Terracidiphilus sp.]|uniref:lytic transglycosylase domain-containing protein n=1 Tax=Terracidiphilus sp. TaxID=1964191 RepID=UPI003C29436E